MSLFYVPKENLLVQMPRDEEKSFEKIKRIFGKETIVLCFGSCLGKPNCPFHSQKTACDNGQKLLKEYRKNN